MAEPTELVTGVNFERIAWCCTEYGIPLEELAAKLNIGASTIQRLQGGDPALTFKQLDKIGDYFGRNILFLINPRKVDRNKLYSPQYRSICASKQSLSRELRLLIERTEYQRNIYLDLIEELDEEWADEWDVEEPAFQPPQVGPDPSHAAAIARRWALAGSEDSFDAYRSAIEDKGILVFRSSVYRGKWHVPKDDPIRVISLCHDNYPLIFVRRQGTPAQQTFALAHALGHILLHQESHADDTADLDPCAGGKEAEANAFAAQFLVPDSHLDSIDDATRPEEVALYEDWLQPHAQAWGVDHELILGRLADAGRLPTTHHRAYRKWRQAQPRQDRSGGRVPRRRHLEPMDIFGAKYVATILHSHHVGDTTRHKAGLYLDGLMMPDLDLLMRGCP